MTEPIVVDQPKALASLPPKPATPATSAASSGVKPAGAKPTTSKPLVAGEPTFFLRLARNRAGVAAAALISLAAGIAAVRLLSPPEDPPTPPVLQEQIPPPGLAPRSDEEPSATSVIPPAGVPTVPVAPSAGPTDGAATGIATPGILPPVQPVAPAAGDPPRGKKTGDAVPPILIPPRPTGDPPAISKPPLTASEPPLPDLEVPSVVPVAGAQPAKSTPMSDPPSPAIPVLSGTPNLDPARKSDPTATPIPKVPVIPESTDVVPPAKDPEPAKKIQGLPLSTADSGQSKLVPPIAPAPKDAASGLPMPADMGMQPGKLPVDPPTGQGVGGLRVDLTKPAGSTAPTERAPTTTYDVDIYLPKPGDTWEAISREYYGDPRFAEGRNAYNRGQLVRGQGVDVPPIHVVKRYLPAATAPVTPTGGFGSTSAPDWGAAATRGTPAGDRPFIVPTGGMSMRAVARLTLGSEQKWNDIYTLNPHLKPDAILAAGTELKLPPLARLP